MFDQINLMMTSYEKLFYLVGAVFALSKYLIDRNDRIKWEKSDRARQLIKDLDDNQLAVNGSYMLGEWSQKSYKITSESHEFKVDQKKLRDVLSEGDLRIDENDIYIRECIDNFLFHLEQISYAIISKTIEKKIVIQLIGSYVRGMEGETKSVLMHYAKNMGYDYSSTFLEAVDFKKINNYFCSPQTNSTAARICVGLL